MRPLASFTAVCCAGALFLGAPFLGLAASFADQAPARADVLDISRGGLLYDKWWAVLETDPPQQTHPAYPAEGKSSGSGTWRCKECHGWDYKGAEGAYRKGSHYTGIKGIRAMAGADPRRIAALLRNKTHRYTEDMIPDEAAWNIALFVSRGQVDMDPLIDRTTKRARGDARRGKRFYGEYCSLCHGHDGREMNFKDDKNPEFIGTVATKNPWEALHKIRNGQPGIRMVLPRPLSGQDQAQGATAAAAMPKMRSGRPRVGMVLFGSLGIQDQIDLLAYTQTLPVE
ncbi:MAG: c-type cytochrome [Rhodospirillales bacterium]|nr:c-type cytochrome [Rhodospirillales bacterium]MDH3970171.1 c-type cytochrome [Rhodospirillales bacterium]